MDCLFCKIIAGDIPSKKFYEDDEMIIIADIDPKAKYHYLLIPKKHFKLPADLTEEDATLLGRCLKKIPTLTEELHLQGGYRLVVNQGDNPGQTVPHLHVHILAGQKMGWQPA